MSRPFRPTAKIPTMKFTTVHATTPTPIQRLLRWSQFVLFTTGIIALGYVGFVMLDARSYQEFAKRSLENQIQLDKEPHNIRFSQAIKPGDVLGRMDIPRLGVSVAVLQGTSPRMLRLGAGHIGGTPLPGEAGNSGIAGHRDTFFRELKDIRGHDEIQFQTSTGLFHYEVDWVKVVGPNDISVLEPSSQAALTLVTCYPFYFLGAAPKRFVVRAHRY
jgi:sortase A